MYDVIVIGGGSGGLASAKKAARLGLSVALCEGEDVGGTCVVRGCIPKKLMVNATKFGHLHTDGPGYGWTGSASFSWETLKASRDQYINKLSQMHTRQLTDLGVTLFSGWAHFIDPQSIQVGDKTIQGKHIIVAVGGMSMPLNVSGGDLATTSRDLFERPTQPKNALIVGAGYIATECATILSGLGTTTTLCIRKKTILSQFDSEMATHLQSELTQSGIHIKPTCEITKISSQGAKFLVTLSTGEEVVTDMVLCAIGRTPLLDPLSLDKVNIPHTNGSIDINKHYQTSHPHIFAIGDCSNDENLTPVAIAEGRFVIDFILKNDPTPFSYDTIPHAVFSDPEYAYIGCSESQAIEHYGTDSVKIFRSSFTSLYYALSTRKPKTLLKVICLKKAGNVIGLHMVGDGAAEIIQSLAVAFQKGITKEDLDQTMALHPTVSEEFVTLY